MIGVTFSSQFDLQANTTTIAININHPALLEPIKKFAIKNLKIAPESLLLERSSIKTLNLRLIPITYRCEVYHSEETQITLLKTKFYSSDIPLFLSIPLENIFNKFSRMQIWNKLGESKNCSILFYCENRKDLEEMRAQLIEKDFKLLFTNIFTLQPPQPIKLHELFFRVDLLVINFFFVDKVQEMGETNTQLIEEKVVEMMGPINLFSYLNLELLELYLNNYYGSMTVTFGQGSSKENS
jgi:hypothetical protein